MRKSFVVLLALVMVASVAVAVDYTPQTREGKDVQSLTTAEAGALATSSDVILLAPASIVTNTVAAPQSAGQELTLVGSVADATIIASSATMLINGITNVSGAISIGSNDVAVLRAINPTTWVGVSLSEN